MNPFCLQPKLKNAQDKLQHLWGKSLLSELTYEITPSPRSSSSQQTTQSFVWKLSAPPAPQKLKDCPV